MTFEISKKDDYYFKGVVPSHTVLEKYFTDMYPKSRSKCFSVKNKLDIAVPYPEIIDLPVSDVLKGKKSK